MDIILCHGIEGILLYLNVVRGSEASPRKKKMAAWFGKVVKKRERERERERKRKKGREKGREGQDGGVVN